MIFLNNNLIKQYTNSAFYLEGYNLLFISGLDPEGLCAGGGGGGGG